MKKIYFILLILLCIATLAEGIPSRAILSGRVLDKSTKEPVAGANIYIPDLKIGVNTDTLGKYSFSNLPSTSILVEVSFIGYKTIIEKIDLNTVSNKDFYLETNVAELNTVVITGSSDAVELRRNPVPVITINRQELFRMAGTNIIDAIADLPGLGAVTTGPNISKPFIHGLGYNRVLTLYDGVRQEGQQWGDEHGIEVDEYDVNRIEVVKGPASLIYGSDALAGVVNLLPAPIVQDGKIIGTISTNYQTNNNLISGSASVSGNINGLVCDARVSHKQATDYKNNRDGRVYNTAFNETDANVMIGLNRSWGYSLLNFTTYNDMQEIPDGSRDSTTGRFTKQITEEDTNRPVVTETELNSCKISDLHQHILHYKVYSSNNFILGNAGKITFVTGAQRNIRHEFSHPQYTSIPDLFLILNSYTCDLKYFVPEIKGWKINTGVNGMFQTNKNKGTEFIIPDYRQFDFGPFILIKKNFDKLDIAAGLRYDSRHFRNYQMHTGINPVTGFEMLVHSTDSTSVFSNCNRVFSGITGSAGATYNFSNNISVKIDIARGTRAPNISEISANGVHPGTGIYQIGNLSKSEFGMQETIGLFFNSNYINGSIELFNNNITNYIFNQRLLNHNGSDSVIVKGTKTYKFQQSDAWLYGGEMNLDIHPHPLDWLHFENSLSLVYAENKGGHGIHISDSSRYLPFIPPVHFHSELRAVSKKRIMCFSALFITLSMDHHFAQNRVYLTDATETPTSAYTLMNLSTGTDITNKKGRKILTLQVLCSNFTDVAYQSHLSRLKYMDFYINKSGEAINVTGRGSGIYNMGRNISFKCSIPLEFKR